MEFTKGLNMAMAKDIMTGGISSGSAQAINGLIQPAVSAAGTTQGTATTLTASISILTTCAAGAGVILPSCQPGDEVEILNLGAGTGVVYPDSGSRINAIATNSGFNLPPNTSVKVRRWSSTRWTAYLSA